MKHPDGTSPIPKAVPMKEHAWRSLVKTVSWRLLGTVDTIIISFLITGSLIMATSIGSIELVTKMVLYYFHERAWNRVRLGLVPASEPEYHI